MGIRDNQIVKNASWIIVCRVFQSLISFVIGMISARYLGPSNYGLINYASSIIAFVVPLAQLGLRNVLVEEIISHPEREGKTLGTSLVMSSCMSLLCIAGCLAFVSIVNALFCSRERCRKVPESLPVPLQKHAERNSANPVLPA